MGPKKILCGGLKDIAVGAVAAAYTLLLIISLDLRKTIVFECRALLRREIVKPRIVVAKDRSLNRTVCRSQGLEHVLLLHLIGNLEPAQGFDLPLRGSGPDRIWTPDHVIRAHTLDHRAHHKDATRGSAKCSGRIFAQGRHTRSLHRSRRIWDVLTPTCFPLRPTPPSSAH